MGSNNVSDEEVTQELSIYVPAIQLKIVELFLGANIATKWYCALEMGAMEAISASDEHNAKAPEYEKMKPYTRDTGPPLRRPA